MTACAPGVEDRGNVPAERRHAVARRGRGTLRRSCDRRCRRQDEDDGRNPHSHAVLMVRLKPDTTY
jgi:hypothetical protein